MTTVAQVTAGSVLYLQSIIVSPHTALLVPQNKGFSMVGGGQRKKIDISNFDSAAYDEYAGGRAAPSELSGELVLDLSNAGHQALKSIFEAGADGTIGNFSFYIGQSNGTGAPTIVAGALVPPQTASPKKWTRGGFEGSCYVANLTPKGADNEVWRCDLKLQITGKTTWQVKGQAIAMTY